MKTLSEILKEIESLRSVIDMDITSVQPATRAGWEAAQSAAKTKIDSVKDEYARTAKSVSVGIYLGGDREVVQAAVKVAQDKGDALVVNGNEIYERIALPVYAMMGGSGLLSASQSARILQELTQIGNELKIASMPIPDVAALSGQKHVPDLGSLVDIIRDSIRKAVGDELAMMYTTKKVGDLALEMKMARPLIPVVLLNVQQEQISNETAAGMWSDHYVVEAKAGDDPESLVLDVFNAINDKLKNNKKKKK